MNTVEVGDLTIGTGHPPRIMGVLNLSRESPYKPSVYDDPDQAAAYVEAELVDQGADIVDIGLESANKRFEVLTAEEELDRLDLALETLDAVDTDAIFSIETRYHEVAEAALDGGFDMVNDVCGFADPAMPDVCSDHDAAVVKMASPPDLERPGAVESVDGIYEALKRGGLTDKTIIDPAFGGWSEGKTLEEDRETFRRLREFQALERPILVSINRKNFLRHLAGRSTEDALPVSLAATSMAIERGADVVRTHDVAETRDAAIIGDAFAEKASLAPDIGVTELDIATRTDLERHLDAVGAGDADPGNGVATAFAITGLERADKDALLAAARSRSTLCASDGARLIIAGSLAALAELEIGDKTSERLEAVVDHIHSVCR
ncbi:MAG: dihydropteroate synthase [Salinirussus sp.]